jgi:hypothetical protein
MRGFRVSPLYCKVHKVQIKKKYYRGCLIIVSISIYLVHVHAPDYEVHVALLANLLFAVDPTV